MLQIKLKYKKDFRIYIGFVMLMEEELLWIIIYMEKFLQLENLQVL